uniref:Uncharacterized protein n=1 Tax=Dunaliella tertiolecta TaxID=3047 RepID=A0A7S3VTJ2_DUNTE
MGNRIEFSRYLISPDGLAALGKFGCVVYEKLGSWEMVAAVVTALYNKLFYDPRTEPFFRNLDHSRVMAHFTGFLSCALGNRMPLSPKQVWLIHRDMLWSPARALQQASHAALAEGRHYPASNHSQASTSSTMLSSACPMMTADRPSADSDSAVVHHGCPVAGQSGHSQAASMTSADSDSTMSKSGLDGCPVAGPSWTAAGPSSMLGACPVTPTHRLSANSDSTSVHNGCPVAGHSQAEGGVGPPILRPDHVNILIEMLRDVLTELDAKEELINETTSLLHSLSWVFERGDIFDDPRNEEKQWQDSHSTQGFVDPHAYTNVDPWVLVAATVENC